MTEKQTSPLNTNSIAFIGLCNEYCVMLENCSEIRRDEFINAMLRMLPRLYIMATDLDINITLDENDAYIDNALDEDYYESVRRNIESLTGPDDIYLEVFEEDMKYSDTPVSASIAEGLSDIFQVLFNFLATIKDATDRTIELALISIRDDFRSNWSAKLCNTLRAINNLAYRE